jgi:hypothetical protein
MLAMDVTGSLGDEAYGEMVFGATSAVPLPASVWLFGSGLLGLIGISRNKKAA